MTASKYKQAMVFQIIAAFFAAFVCLTDLITKREIGGVLLGLGFGFLAVALAFAAQRSYRKSKQPS